MTMEKNILMKMLLAGYTAGVIGVPKEDFLALVEVSLG